MRNGGRGAERPENFRSVTVVLRFAVQHVAGGTDDGTQYRVGTENSRTNGTGAAPQERLLTGGISACGKTRAGRQYKECLFDLHGFCPLAFLLKLSGKCRSRALLFNNSPVRPLICADFCHVLPDKRPKKDADRFMWGT